MELHVSPHAASHDRVLGPSTSRTQEAKRTADREPQYNPVGKTPRRGDFGARLLQMALAREVPAPRVDHLTGTSRTTHHCEVHDLERTEDQQLRDEQRQRRAAE